jgi:hypothetical protein
MDALKARFDETKDGISRQSTLVGAINYALNHWHGLTLFLEDGRLEPDTNIVERSIRPIGIGKKNSLFCGNEGGGETWAILASLLNTCLCRARHKQLYAARRTMPNGSGRKPALCALATQRAGIAQFHSA